MDRRFTAQAGEEVMGRPLSPQREIGEVKVS